MLLDLVLVRCRVLLDLVLVRCRVLLDLIIDNISI